jgi:hypothetical protein
MRLRTSGGIYWEKQKNPTQALLYDFSVNHAELKAEHIRYLDTVIQGISTQPGKTWHLHIEGRASRTGKEDHNLALSRERAYSVHRYLKAMLKNVDMKVDWVGESRAAHDGQKDGKENMMYRAVELVVRTSDQPQPPPLPIDPPAPREHPGMKAFRIRMVSGSSNSLTIPLPLPVLKVITPSISREEYLFEIYDLEEKKPARYRYQGQGTGLGPGLSLKGFSASWTYQAGDWNDFSAPRWIAVTDFGGPATMEAVGASGLHESISKTHFAFRPLHWYSPGPGIHIWNFKTGTSMSAPGAGITSSQGAMTLLPK